MAFNEKEQEIIKWGLANGKSKSEVTQAINNFRLGISVPKKEAVETKPAEPSFVDGLKEDLNTRVERTGDILNRKDTSIAEKGVQLFGQGAGLASNVIEKTVEQVPGVKQAIGALGSGINWLATSEMSPIKHLGDVIGSSKGLQEIVNLYDTDPNFKDSVDAVANIARLGGNVQLAEESQYLSADSVNFTKNVTNKIIDKTKSMVPPPPSGPSKPITPILDVSKMVPESTAIMNRVARLKPTDFTKFEKMAGKTPGEYLTETGNFGPPDKIITNEASKFVKSMNSVDDELAKLPGTFEDGSISDALNGLVERAKSTSGNNVKSPYLDKVLALERKHASKGLDMSEINEVKRLYEKNVKLGYNKLTNAEKVEQSTNIDRALREWQVQKAKELGFKNIEELNKQTQISRFLVDKLGDQVIGQSGLNGVNITDWVMLSGGDPTAVAGFLTKKFFSSKTVQAKIAELMNKGKEIKGQITPDIGTSQVKQLPAGSKDLPTEGAVYAPIKMLDESVIEAQATNPVTTSVNKTGDVYVKDLKTGKTTIIPSKK